MKHITTASRHSGAVLIPGGIGGVFLKEALSILEILKRMGVYVTPGIKKKILEWMGDLEKD